MLKSQARLEPPLNPGLTGSPDGPGLGCASRPGRDPPGPGQSAAELGGAAGQSPGRGAEVRLHVPPVRPPGAGPRRRCPVRGPRSALPGQHRGDSGLSPAPTRRLTGRAPGGYSRGFEPRRGARAQRSPRSAHLTPGARLTPMVTLAPMSARLRTRTRAHPQPRRTPECPPWLSPVSSCPRYPGLALAWRAPQPSRGRRIAPRSGETAENETNRRPWHSPGRGPGHSGGPVPRPWAEPGRPRFLRAPGAAGRGGRRGPAPAPGAPTSGRRHRSELAASAHTRPFIYPHL